MYLRGRSHRSALKNGYTGPETASSLHRSSELRVSCRAMHRDETQQEDTAAVWLYRTGRMETTGNIPTKALPTIRDAKEESNPLGPAGSSMKWARAETVCTESNSRNGDGNDKRLVHLTNKQVVVDRATLVSMNGDLERESAELVRLHPYVALLNQSTYRLEQKYTEVEVTMRTWLRHGGMENSNGRSLFRGARTPQTVCTYVDDILFMLKDEGV